MELRESWVPNMAHDWKLSRRDGHACPVHNLSQSKVSPEGHCMREPRKLTKT